MRALVTLVAVLTLVILWSGGLAVRLRKVNQARAEQQREQEDPVLPLERRQQRLLDRQLASLKRHLPGRQGLYRLPWYLVMGLEDAGKTSLIQRSGQTYTLTNVTRNERTDRNPLGFDWWIGDHGVLIDPDGGLLSQNPEEGVSAELPRRLWQHFLQWLEQNRPQRPLNGVVLAVDLPELSVASDEQRQAEAIRLRTRLRELMEQLGSRLPVYVCFTKIDRLYGFAPFLRTLSKAERAQPMGFTFRLAGGPEADDWLLEFADRYEGWVKALGQRLPEAQAQARELEERAAAFSFTRQLAGLKPGAGAVPRRPAVRRCLFHPGAGAWHLFHLGVAGRGAGGCLRVRRRRAIPDVGADAAGSARRPVGQSVHPGSVPRHHLPRGRPGRR